jgi:hypothetical protein
MSSYMYLYSVYKQIYFSECVTVNLRVINIQIKRYYETVHCNL